MLQSHVPHPHIAQGANSATSQPKLTSWMKHVALQAAAPEPTSQQEPPPPRPAPAPEPRKEAAMKSTPAPKPAEDSASNGKPEMGKPEKGKPEKEGEAAGEMPPPAEAGSGGGGSNGGGGGGKAEDQLPANSAGSAASRHGGSVYDIIVQVCFHFARTWTCGNYMAHFKKIIGPQQGASSSTPMLRPLLPIWAPAVSCGGFV
jgi:hypothetical protein